MISKSWTLVHKHVDGSMSYQSSSSSPTGTVIISFKLRQCRESEHQPVNYTRLHMLANWKETYRWTSGRTTAITRAISSLNRELRTSLSVKLMIKHINKHVEGIKTLKEVNSLMNNSDTPQFQQINLTST